MIPKRVVFEVFREIICGTVYPYKILRHKQQ